MNTPAISRLTAPIWLLAARLQHGRPLGLAARILGAAALAQITLHSGAGPAPEGGVLAGILTWLALTLRGDLAPPPGR
jgi:hypothetical protein